MTEEEAIKLIKDYCKRIHAQPAGKPKWISSTTPPDELKEAVEVVGYQKYFTICLMTLCKKE